MKKATRTLCEDCLPRTYALMTPVLRSVFEVSTSAPLSSAIDVHKSKTQLVKYSVFSSKELIPRRSTAALMPDVLEETKPR